MKRRKSSLLRIMFVVTAILGISLWINMSQGLEVQA
ncbi:internalin N-terminal domain-containing protein [Listeria marthii]|nr:internalin N-terminal domain-containing protein [Listeria marthii]